MLCVRPTKAAVALVPKVLRMNNFYDLPVFVRWAPPTTTGRWAMPTLQITLCEIVELQELSLRKP